MYITNDRPNVAGLVLSGSADFKTELSQSDMFDPRLQAVVLGVLDVSYGEEAGYNLAVASQVSKKYRLQQYAFWAGCWCGCIGQTRPLQVQPCFQTWGRIPNPLPFHGRLKKWLCPTSNCQASHLRQPTHMAERTLHRHGYTSHSHDSTSHSRYHR